MKAIVYRDKHLVFMPIVPEKPRQRDFEAGGDPPVMPAYVDPEYYNQLEIYQEALLSAPVIPFHESDRNFIEAAIKMGMPDRGAVWEGIQENVLYPIPVECEVKTEMHNPCLKKRDCQSPGENGWKCLHNCKLQHLVAILKLKEPEIKEGGERDTLSKMRNSFSFMLL